MATEPAQPALQKQPSKSRHPTLFLSNLPQNIATVQVDEVFHAKGFDVANVELLKKGSGSWTKTCGLGVVTMHDDVDLNACVEALDGQMLCGRPIILRKDKFVEDCATYEHVPAPALHPGASPQPAK